MMRHSGALAASVLALNLNIVATAGVIFCEDSMACVNLPGYTCKNDRCVCEPSHSGLFPCVANEYGEKCRSNEDCLRIDEHMECSASEARTCRCQRGLLWDEASRRCYLLDDTSFYTRSFDPVRDLIIPGIIVMTIGAMREAVAAAAEAARSAA
ncbi:Uncharacterized protein GBIM_10016 [Gryllus bimaculatus]|nr:Uncharacterized protein GBIM_10016 [Gryllus bimaculatus]